MQILNPIIYVEEAGRIRSLFGSKYVIRFVYAIERERRDTRYAVTNSLTRTANTEEERDNLISHFQSLILDRDCPVYGVD